MKRGRDILAKAMYLMIREVTEERDLTALASVEMRVSCDRSEWGGPWIDTWRQEFVA